MRQVFSRLVVTAGLFTLACAVAVEDPPLGGNNDAAGSGGGFNMAGSTVGISGTTPMTAGATSMPQGGNSGSVSNPFGGSAPTGGKGGDATGGQASSGSGGVSSGGSGGGGAGGKGGSASGGMSGSATGGGGSGTAGSPSTGCNGVADWSAKAYAFNEAATATCGNVFPHGCTAGEKHRFECTPATGAGAILWCMQRHPGVDNGWWEAWVDKGKCQ